MEAGSSFIGFITTPKKTKGDCKNNTKMEFQVILSCSFRFINASV